ncbi:glycosyltransferase family 20-domain-containing protein [Lipomyces kononenkoae]|uniref:Glycosyltransferase family 20-domain-containing protein n=1 Tax=Lipomyces kononenkoae TaxID=34357 RepID=A0ACC3T560_LIPKO
MSLLVASLYLPHTIHFNLDDPRLVERVSSMPILSRSPSTASQPYDAPAQAPTESTSHLLSHSSVQSSAVPTPIPNFIRSLASRVTSTQNTPPASPPATADVEDFFFKLSTPPSVTSHSAPNLDSVSGIPGSNSAPSVEFERNFRSIYARSLKKAAAAAAAAAAASAGKNLQSPTINSNLSNGLSNLTISNIPDLTVSDDSSGITSPTSSSFSNGLLTPLVVTHPKSRASSPPPAKHLVTPRNKSIPDVPSLRIAPKKVEVSKSSPLDAASAFKNAPWSVVKYHKGNGGLRNAIARAEAEGTISNKRWIGTLGMPTDALEDATKKAIEEILLAEYQDAPVFVTDSTFEGHYTHYCKDILWPTFHYQIPDNPKSKAYEDHSWVHYHTLNTAFADRVVANYSPGDTIWVHDYHLLLVPGLVRKKIPDAKIGFFLHIAFPSSEVYRCLPTRKLLLRGMLGADVVGFQSNEYARHFRQTVQVVLGIAPNRDDTIDYEGRRVAVVAMAIGIDPLSLKLASEDPEVKRWRQMLRERWPDKKMIVGRDKLDQFRGVRHKMLGYERFLKSYPEYKENAIFIQVCLTNIASQDLESEVYDIVTRINSSTHVVSEPPVVFLHQDISFEQYLALLYEADVFVVTSLREGMNLTCHEYIFCQRETSKGPLILSEFTGSAAVLGDKCLLVNPWDRVQVADAFHKSLTMPEEEREERYEKLYSEVTTNTCAHWVRLFLNKLDKTWEEHHRKN